MREENEEYFEEESEPEKNVPKGVLLSPFAALFTVIVCVVALAFAIISAPFVFAISLFRLSFDFRLTARYSLSVLDKIATVAFALVFEVWYGIFHKGE